MTAQTRTGSALLACLLTAAMAVPVWSDTLILRNGTTFSGTLTGANTSTLTFRDRNGRSRRFAVRDVDAVQFGDASYRGYDRDNRYPDQGYPNQGNRGYGQDRMERVVLPAGTEIAVRTNERIDVKDVVEGQTFSAQIDQDVRDTEGSIAIPRRSDAQLIARRVEKDGDIFLDVESITVEGRRYRVSTADEEIKNRRQGIGGNKRTGEFVGGGAVLGAVIGAIAGGGKGAAIGAAAGAGAGAATQIITRGKEVHVPAETVLRFRLDQPLRLRLWS